MKIKAEMLAAIIRDFPDLPASEIKPVPISEMKETTDKDVSYVVVYMDRENGIAVSIPRKRAR